MKTNCTIERTADRLDCLKLKEDKSNKSLLRLAQQICYLHIQVN